MAQIYIKWESHPFTLKGLLLDKSRTLEFIAGNNQDTLTQEVYADWKSILRSLAAESSKPNFQRDTILIKELETLQNIAEKKLSRNLSQFSKDRSLLSWQDISKVLQPGEASVEFCHYRYGQIENVDSSLG